MLRGARTGYDCGMHAVKRRWSWSRALLLCGLTFGLPCLGCGPDWHARYDESQDELAQTRGELADVQARLDQLEQDAEGMRALLEAQGEDMSNMAEVRARLQNELEEARAREAEHQARLSALRAMARQFRDMVAAGQLRVRIVRGNMVVELPDDVLFDSGRAEVKPAGEATLERVAEVLASVPNRDFLVAGHTDNVPVRRGSIHRNNWSLSAARGVAVVGYLTEHGMPPERLTAAGFADTRPVASNSSPEGRAQNRRIEIIVMPNLDELPDLSELEGDLESEAADDGGEAAAGEGDGSEGGPPSE